MKDLEENDNLHFAVQDGDLEQVKQLIEDGVPVNRFDDCDYTPLHYAVEQENFEICECLLDNGADVNAQNHQKAGNTPLGNVGGTCSLKMAKFLVNHGADPSAPGWMQLSAIQRASKRKKPEGIEVYNYLLRHEKA